MIWPKPPGAVIWLDSDSLFSKWGFRDGDAVREADVEIPDGLHSHVILCDLVRTHLLPVLSREIRVYEINSCHNPIRADDEEVNDIPYTGMWVTDEMVRSSIQRVLGKGVES